jgi:hypothetical protein
MTHLVFSLTGPAGLLIVFCGFALLIGIDPWRLARNFALCVPIVAYVIFRRGDGVRHRPSVVVSTEQSVPRHVQDLVNHPMGYVMEMAANRISKRGMLAASW